MSKSSEVDYYIVIPARFASERLPGKMLLEIGGKPLIQHTWERARQSGAIVPKLYISRNFDTENVF